MDMFKHSDETLVSEALEGSQLAFEQLVKQYQYHVLRTALSILNDEQAAQDVVQETFLSAYINLMKLRDKRKFGGWLTRITINLSKRWLRDQRKYRENTTSLEETESAVVTRVSLQKSEGEKLRQEVWDAIDELSEAQREVVILHYISGYSYKEIAETLSVSPSTVLGRLQKARNQLRKEFLDMVTSLQLEVDSTLYKFLKRHAGQLGMSVEDLIARLVEGYKRDIDTADERAENFRADMIPIPEEINPEPLKQMAQDFFESLINKDFEKASAISSPNYCDMKWGGSSYADIVEVISIGEPFQKKGRTYAGGNGVFVPYEIKFANGYVKKWQIAMRNDNPEGKWVFDGGL
jgi:RNA polymerase sigma-70 factor (ECF subfamily)